MTGEVQRYRVITENEETGKITGIRELDEDIYLVEYDSLSYINQVGGMVFLASYIAMLARVALMVFILTGTGSGTMTSCLYSDTDSIIVTDDFDFKAVKHLIGTSLGMFKPECTDISRVVLVAPKVYLTEDPVNGLDMKCKGIKKKFVTEELFETLLREKKVGVPMTNFFFRKWAKVEIRDQLRTIKIPVEKDIEEEEVSKPEAEEEEDPLAFLNNQDEDEEEEEVIDFLN